jgi:diaminopimelate epimerase
MNYSTLIPFIKMQSAGNDFILIDSRRLSRKIKARDAGRLLNRQFGIGGDQLLLLGRPTTGKADISLKIFNPDGSEAEMCGNGVLCVADYLKGYHRQLAIETKAGLIKTSLSPRIEVDMGKPAWKGIEKTLTAGGRKFKFTDVSMGNPHCVIFLERLKDLSLEKYGPLIENHPLFPKRTNVEFVEGNRVRVWERGAGPTLSCGTGACAVLVAGVLTRRLLRSARLHFPGGILAARWAGDNHVYLSSRSMGAVFQGGIK